MWLQGKENFLITMDSHGRIVCHDLLNQPFSHTLTSSLERGRKCFFLKKFFFLAVIQGNETFLNFFTIPIKNMQKQNFARTVVLQNINVTIWDIQEIDSKTGTIVIRNSNFIQFWKILTSKLAYQIPFTQNIETRVSSDHFIF